ncbi:MAG: cytochrome c oxidase subunit II [Actinomycetota bacterium]|nr:cytochrome c oxidase subunit II [Actinomycetota bacterium]
MGHERHRIRRRRLALTFATIAVLLLALAASASADLITPESGGSRNADEIDSLYKIILVLAFLVFFGVEGVLVYSLVKFRARRGAVAAQIRGNTRLEIGWTIGASVILVVLAVVTFVKLNPIRNPPNSDANGFQASASGVQMASAFRPKPPNGKALNIKVNGQQYVWRYTYPDGDTNVLNNAFSYGELVVPTNTTVTLDINAQDVAHSWWIPKLGGKFDAIPGYTNHTWFKIPKPAVYDGRCAELCGRGHANMIATVRALPPAQFERWLADKRAQLKQADTAAAQSRRQIQRQQSGGNAAP